MEKIRIKVSATMTHTFEVTPEQADALYGANAPAFLQKKFTEYTQNPRSDYALDWGSILIESDELFSDFKFEVYLVNVDEEEATL